jgi:hypothetical protein
MCMRQMIEDEDEEEDEDEIKSTDVGTDHANTNAPDHPEDRRLRNHGP